MPPQGEVKSNNVYCPSPSIPKPRDFSLQQWMLGWCGTPGQHSAVQISKIPLCCPAQTPALLETILIPKCWFLQSCARLLKHHQMSPVRVSRGLSRPAQTGWSLCWCFSFAQSLTHRVCPALGCSCPKTWKTQISESALHTTCEPCCLLISHSAVQNHP